MTTIWSVILVTAIVIEAITIDLVSIWFGAGALVALLSEVLFHVHSNIQIALFAIVSIICIVLSRPLAKRYLRGNTVKTNYDRIIGKHCLVSKSITADHRGEIIIMGNTWSAASLNNEEIEEGMHAEIVAIEGAHVIVKKI